MWGHSAGGAQCTCSTPRTDTQNLPAADEDASSPTTSSACRHAAGADLAIFRDSLCPTAVPFASTGARRGRTVGRLPHPLDPESAYMPLLSGPAPAVMSWRGGERGETTGRAEPRDSDIHRDMYGLQLDQLAELFGGVTVRQARALVTRWGT